MSIVDRYKALALHPQEWNDREPSDEECKARNKTLDELWDSMTDEERTLAGAPRVVCAVCQRNYGQGNTPVQAADCAASIDLGSDGKLYLLGHYGSDTDGTAFVLSSEPGEPFLLKGVKLSPKEGQIVANALGTLLRDRGVDLTPVNSFRIGKEGASEITFPVDFPLNE